LGVLVGGLVRASIIARVMGRTFVVGMRRMAGSRGVILSATEVAKGTSTHQFFNFILECFAILHGVAMIAVIAAIFGHIGVGGCGRLAWRRDEVGL